MPTRNSEWCLPITLSCLKDQTVKPEEILICVGESYDKTEEFVLDFQRESFVPVKALHDLEGKGTGYAMNKLVSEASYDWILWLGSDFIFPKNFIKIAKFLIENFDTEVWGVSVVETPRYFVPSDYVFRHNIEEWSPNKRFSAPIVSKRETLLKAGNFDPWFSRGQDLDLMLRVRYCGAKISVCSDLKLYHFGIEGKGNLRKSLAAPTFFRFLYKYSWKVVFHCRHNFLGSLLRMAFLSSSIGLAFSPLLWSPIAWHFGLIFLSLLATILLGTVHTYKKISLSLLMFQIGMSVGEFFQLYRILRDKDRPKFGYGRRLLE